MEHLQIHIEEFQRLLTEFRVEVRTRGYRNSKMSPTMIKEFLWFIESRGLTSLSQVKAAEIIDYYEHVRERPNHRREGGLSESMIRHHMYSLRLFFDYLLDVGEIETSPARLPKFTFGKPKPRNIPDLKEIQLIYAACETKRDRAFISVAYGCGLRRSEIAMLNVGDVLFYKAQLIIREGKGGKYRTIPLSEKILRYLKEYIVQERAKYFPARTKQSTNAFFLNDHGNRYQGDKLNARLRELIQMTKNQRLISKHITLHCLRHAFATHLLDNGANIEFVQQLLGHAELDTVHLYSKRRKQHLAVKNQFDRPYAQRTHL